jgi:hypothetical protein
MKKIPYIFGAFSLGCALTLGVLFVAERLTYATNLFKVCLISDAVVGVFMGITIVLDRIELTIAQNEAENAMTAQDDAPVELPNIFGKHEAAEMEETAPIPEMLEVTNDSVKRVEE